jgi:hypothetical protein
MKMAMMASDPGVGRDGLDRPTEVAAARGREHIDGVRHGRRGRQVPAQRLARGGPQRLDAQPRGAARVGARDRRSAGVRHDRHATAGGQRLARQKLGDVELLVERHDADDAGMVEEGVDRGLGGLQQGARVRRRRPPSGDRAPALDRDDGLGGRQASRDLAEAPRVAERFEVQQHRVRSRVLLPEAQEVVAGQVGLVAHRDERREPEAAPRGEVEGGDPVGPALGGERDPSRRRSAGREGRVHPDLGRRVQNAQAVWSDEPHARLAADAQQLGLALAALGPGLPEAGGQHDQRGHAGRRAVAHRVEDGRRRDGDDRQLDGRRHVGQRGVRRPPGDGLGVRVDRIHTAPETRGHEIARDCPAHAGLPPRRADDRDRGRLQDVTDGRDRRGPVALLEALARGAAQLGGQLDLQEAGLGTDLHGEARVAQHAQHAVVVRMHEGRQGHDAGRLGDLGEVRKYERGDPAPLPRVGHGEGQLRPFAIGLGDQAGMGDDVPVDAGGRDEAYAVTYELARRTGGGDAPPRKRNQRASGDRPSRKAATASTSAATAGRTWTVEPSRSTTSVAPSGAVGGVSSPARCEESEMAEVIVVARCAPRHAPRAA